MEGVFEGVWWVAILAAFNMQFRENSEIVDEDIHVFDTREQFLDSGQRAEIGRNALGVCSDFRDSLLDPRLGSSIDVDECAFARQSLGDGKSDARRGTRDDCPLSLKS